MKISEQWLREWVDPAIDTDTLARQLTMAGLEIEALEPVAGEFSGVVVGEILEAAPHPDADRLRVCRVSSGAQELQIVCGAPNARAGLKAPLATVGGVLPGDFRIKQAKLRGVESQGMLCAEAELGLSEANEGLMELAADAPVGADLRDYLGLDDTVLEIGLTPNRADCLGVRGIAREVGLLNDCAVQAVSCAPVAPTLDETFPVELLAPQRCPHFVGRVIRGVDLSRPSPLWMQEKLRRSGLRSIDAVVDVTNYVMLELGQPMHAFDFDRLRGGIRVRCAQAGEKLRLLDGSEVELHEDNLVIADHDGAAALAGIMGGERTGVSEVTKSMFLEVAIFDQISVATTGRKLNIHSDARFRFERGLDVTSPEWVSGYVARMVMDICGGEASHVVSAGGGAALP